MILVTCYTRNDLDGAACVYAYAEFLQKKGINAVGAIFGKPHREAQFVMDSFKIKKFPDASKVLGSQKIILVDASDVYGISPKINTKNVIEIIDHRKFNTIDKFPNAKAQIELVGAAATLIAEKFYNEKIPISKESALFLISAIISNTINFKGITTEKDKKMYKWLSKQAKMPKNFVHKMFLHKSKFNKSLKKIIEDDFSDLVLNGKNFGIAQLEIVNAEKFMKDNMTEIRKILGEIKKERAQDLIFLTCIDIEKGFNIFVTIDRETEDLISSTLNIKFVNGTTRRKGIIMRKQITPMIKEKMKI